MAPIHNVMMIGLATAAIMRLIRGAKPEKVREIVQCEPVTPVTPQSTCPSSPKSGWKDLMWEVGRMGGWLLLMVHVVHGVFGPVAAMGVLMMACCIINAWKTRRWTGDEEVKSCAVCIIVAVRDLE